jgi:hypothetical protein
MGIRSTLKTLKSLSMRNGSAYVVVYGSGSRAGSRRDSMILPSARLSTANDKYWQTKQKGEPIERLEPKD